MKTIHTLEIAQAVNFDLGVIDVAEIDLIQEIAQGIDNIPAVLDKETTLEKGTLDLENAQETILAVDIVQEILLLFRDGTVEIDQDLHLEKDILVIIQDHRQEKGEVVEIHLEKVREGLILGREVPGIAEDHLKKVLLFVTPVEILVT